MKDLKTFINEQMVFEMSDDLLQRAIDKCYAQNTALMRRRAKEFEKYLKDPERIKRAELSLKSKATQQFTKAYDENIVKAYELYDNGKKKESIDYFDKFGYELGKIINGFTTTHIEVKTTGKFYSYRNYGGKYYISDKPGLEFSRKRDGELFNEGIVLRIYLNLQAPEDKLIAHDYRQKIEARLTMQFYNKENRTSKYHGEYSMFLDIPWYCIPPDYEEELKEIYGGFCELKGEQIDDYYQHFLGEDSLERYVPGWELLINTFNAELDKNSSKEVIQKIADVLKENDPKCKVEFDKELKSSRGDQNDINAKLTYKGTKYDVACKSNFEDWRSYGSIMVNGKPIFKASSQKYDYGIWSNSKYKPCEELKEFFKD